jgi:hypothetical protein
MLNRLDAHAERLGAGQHALAARWADYLDALGADRREDALVLLKPQPEIDALQNPPQHQFHQLSLEEEEEGEPIDDHILWERDGVWWTDYPPPPGYDGIEEGSYGARHYARTLTPAEAAVMEARQGRRRADRKEEARLRAERQRGRFFGFTDDGEESSCEDGFDTPASPPPSHESMHIRPYTPADAPALADLYARFAGDFGPHGYRPEQGEAGTMAGERHAPLPRIADT